MKKPMNNKSRFQTICCFNLLHGFCFVSLLFLTLIGCVKKNATERLSEIKNSENEQFFSESDCVNGTKIGEFNGTVIKLSTEKRAAGSDIIIYSVKPMFVRNLKAASTNGLLTHIFQGRGSSEIVFNESGLENYRKCYNKILAFVFAHYQDRRNWSDSFIQELKKIAKNYELFSEYVVVAEKSDAKIKGTIRFISAPYARLYFKYGGVGDNSALKLAASFAFPWSGLSEGHAAGVNLGQLREQLSVSFKSLDFQKESENNWISNLTPLLPLEEIGFKILRNASGRCEPERNLQLALGKDQGFETLKFSEQTEVCFGLGELIEPGNLAVNKISNDEVRPLLITEMARRLLNDATDLQTIVKNRKLLTYNDKHRLYTLMGMTLTGQSIEKYGNTWKLLESTPSQFFAHFGVVLVSNQNAQAENMMQRIEATIKNMDWKYLEQVREFNENAESKTNTVSFIKAHENYFNSLRAHAVENKDLYTAGSLQEKCGFIRKQNRNESGKQDDSEFMLETLFGKEKFVLVPHDGSALNMLVHASESSVAENLTPYCVFADFQNQDEVIVASGGKIRPW